jgi:hypothetical protein
MKRLYTVFAILTGLLCATNAFAQAVSVTWPLNNTIQVGSSSSAALLATGNNEIVSVGPAPAMQVFDYWIGHVPESQRLWAGTTGWIAGPENANRFIQFDAAPTSGNQLNVINVSFNYGGAGINGHIQANAYYSVDHWSTRTPLNSSPLAYPNQAMLPFAMAITAPPVASGATFSLRIYPYAILNSVAISPTFAVHNNVVISGRSTPVAKGVRFDIKKSTGDTAVPGSYLFTVTCIGTGGPYTGPNPVAVVLPSPGVSTVNVPAGDICGVTEAPPAGNWNPPIFTGSGVPVVMGAPWSAKIGPITANGGVVNVANQPKKADMVRFEIKKSTGDTAIPGSYLFSVTCTGTGGPYTGPNPVAVVLPSPGVSTVSVPAGDLCIIKETQPAGSWNLPVFAGSGVGVMMGAPWEAKVGPITASGGVVNVTNTQKK